MSVSAQTENFNKLVSRFGAKAFIFDLDGTMVDNNKYHLQAFHQYLENIGRKISEEEYKKNINGRTNKDAFDYIFENKLTGEEQKMHAEGKEAVYREVYNQHIAPLNGLLDFLKFAYEAAIPMAIATSGIQPNIDFFFERVPVKQYFSAVINSAHISHGKPHPEIYLKAAEALGIEPQHCIAFEDAVVGVQSAKSAGMKVIAVSTTEVVGNLHEADLVTKDFETLLQIEIG